MLITLASHDLNVCARTVEVLAAGGNNELRAALACTLRNRLVASSLRGPLAPAEICRDFLYQATGQSREHLPREAGSGAEWCRAMAMNCLAWSGDLVDPTNGATSCHRHDLTAPWAAGRPAKALIGDYIFLR
jgi:hypothetical protein